LQERIREKCSNITRGGEEEEERVEEDTTHHQVYYTTSWLASATFLSPMHTGMHTKPPLKLKQ
jgi:hypothetical protein